MERVQVKALPRATASKGYLRKLRADGLVPGIVYGRKSDAEAVTVYAKDITAIIHSSSGANTLVDLTLDGKKDTVMIKELKRDILLSDRFVHVDFVRISLMDKLEVSVPVVLTGDAAGIIKGGILQQMLREVHLNVLPTEIPETFELDITKLDIGESLYVSDMNIPVGFELLTNSSEAVVTIVAPRVADEEDEADAADEAETEEE